MFREHTPHWEIVATVSVMDTKTRAQLENIVAQGSDFYRHTAQRLLAGELTWSDPEIEQFLDGFMNDPYLTRNE